MTITGQSGNLFTYYIFKETPSDTTTKEEILEIIDHAQKTTGEKVKLKFQNLALRRNFFLPSNKQLKLF